MPNDFTKNPGGSAGLPAKPRSFTAPDPRKVGQKSSDGAARDPKSVPAGGPSVLDAVTPREDAGNPIGAGSLGVSRKPYSLKG